MRYPIMTPWGERDSIAEYAEGVAFVSTPSHGGSMVHDSIPLSDAAKSRAIHITDDVGESWYFFEEDCDFAIAVFELPVLMATFSNGDAVYNSLVSWHSDYLMERGIDPTTFRDGKFLLNYVHWLENRHTNLLRDIKDPNMIVSRCWENEQMSVYTANGDRHTFSDRKTNRANRLYDIRVERVSEGYDPIKADAESASSEELQAAQSLLSELTE